MEQEMSNDLAEQLEMVTLDKLVAEERSENLQAEIEDQKDKILALESELALIKSGAAMRNTTKVDSSNNEVASYLLYRE
jgi:dynactin 1